MKTSRLFTNALLILIVSGAAAMGQAAHEALPINPTYVVGGQVIDSAGKPACNIQICAIAEDFDEKKANVLVPCSASDDKGNFMLIINRQGRYKLFPDRTEQGYWTTRIPFFHSPTTPTSEVLLDGTSPRAPVTVLLPPKNGLVKGTAIDVKTGLPVDEVEFVTCHATNQQICWRTVVKNADGFFQIPAPHVPFTLRALAKGFTEWLGVTGHETTAISVASGSTLQLNLFLTRDAASTDKPINEAEKQPGVNLPAPVQLSPDDGIVFNIYPRRTKVEWASVDGAVSYSIEVDYCQFDRNGEPCRAPKPLEVRTNPAMTGILNTNYEFLFVGAQPGRWRVWAVDKDGRDGFKSTWRTFIYRR